MVINKCSNYIKLIKQMGAGWFMFRSFYELQKVTGLLEKKKRFTPITNEDLDCLIERADNKEVLRKKLSSFFINKKTQEQNHNWITANYGQEDKEKLKEIADNSIKGKIFCFSSWYADYGYPIDWHLNPLTGKSYPVNQHWTRIEELQDGEDIKLVWEASRFPHFYYLARAYVLTRNEKYPRAFWEQIEHWWDNNPFDYGPNWFCGQEVALRTMAWIFGLFVFWDSEHTTPERIHNLIKYLWYHGQRIEKNIGFALKALGNNHAISEAAGLFTIGLLFPFFKESRRWKEKGEKYLIQEGLRQIYQDGSYIQHSFNYQRMVIQLYSWCLRLGQLNGVSFKPELLKKLEKCVGFLYSFQEKNTGVLPNYGPNDGSLPFPLTNCKYNDYRPQLNTLWYLLKGKRLYESGMYDEELCWFLGKEVEGEKEEILLEKNAFPEGGYYLLRGSNSKGFTRCTSYKDRPAHADMLHFDLWWKGQNILVDGGSFSYNAPGRTEYFSGTLSHNTVAINEKDQMKKWKRFTWLEWTKARVINFQDNMSINYFEGEHYGYKEVLHRRCIVNKNDLWIVIDDLLPARDSKAKVRLHWLLGNYGVSFNEKKELIINTCKGNLLLYPWSMNNKGEVSLDKGWRSLNYGVKEQLPSLVVEGVIPFPHRFITVIAPEEELCDYSVDGDEIKAQMMWGKLMLSLNNIGEKSIYKSYHQEF